MNGDTPKVGQALARAAPFAANQLLKNGDVQPKRPTRLFLPGDNVKYMPMLRTDVRIALLILLIKVFYLKGRE